MRDFRKLKIWIQAIEIVTKVYALTAKLPDTEKYGLKSQVQRAAVSIPSNIAEGASRDSELEFKRFLEIAIGSSFEVETQLVIAQNLKMLNQDELKEIFSLISSEQKMLNSLISKINIGKPKKPNANS
ncbi:MAG: four helix bundle protein [Bacteroidota bacterium]|nr:four helix bundle protein [Bacteroidota bacterium]